MIIFTSLIIIAIAFYVMTRVVDELFLKSLDNISHWLKLTPSVAGATLLAVGTSAPELSTTMFSLFLDGASPATGLGTVVGSAIFQILVVIGFASLVKTTYLKWKPVVRDGLFYAITVMLLIFVVSDQQITLWESVGLVATYGIYLTVLLLWGKFVDESGEPDPIEVVEKDLDEAKEKNKEKTQQKPLWKKAIGIVAYPVEAVVNLIPDTTKNKRWTFPVFFFSLAVIAYASYWLVIAAEDLAGALGVPPAIVALTILAGGSSIPELISSYIIAKEGRGDMAISNAIGSNTFDILISLGLPVLIFTTLNGSATQVDAQNITSSLILLAATIVTVLSILVTQKFKIGKRFGYLLIGLYIAYVVAAYSDIL